MMFLLENSTDQPISLGPGRALEPGAKVRVGGLEKLPEIRGLLINRESVRSAPKPKASRPKKSEAPQEPTEEPPKAVEHEEES